MTRRRDAATILLALFFADLSPTAWAYRPFDGTDAAVVDPREAEVELGPAGYLRDGPDQAIIAPSLRLNYGFTPGWEAVLEGQAAHGLAGDARRSSLVGNMASLKGVLREGGLQEQPGPSIATEFGVLLPGLGDEPGTGGEITGIVSQAWPWATVHLNAVAAVTRQQHGDLFLGAIVEGPRDWAVRPVAEFFHEQDFGRLRTTSGLVGAIWQVSERLAFDTGFRRAGVNGRTLNEVRAGLTFSFSLR